MQLAKLQFYFKSKGHVTNCHCFVLIVSFLHFVFSSESDLFDSKQGRYVPRINDGYYLKAWNNHRTKWEKFLLQENQLY